MGGRADLMWLNQATLDFLEGKSRVYQEKPLACELRICWVQAAMVKSQIEFASKQGARGLQKPIQTGTFLFQIDISLIKAYIRLSYTKMGEMMATNQERVLGVLAYIVKSSYSEHKQPSWDLNSDIQAVFEFDALDLIGWVIDINIEFLQDHPDWEIKFGFNVEFYSDIPKELFIFASDQSEVKARVVTVQDFLDFVLPRLPAEVVSADV